MHRWWRAWAWPSSCDGIELVLSLDERRRFAALLHRLAQLTSLHEAGRGFRGRAFDRALWALDDLPDFDAADSRLQEIDGVGPGIVGLIREFQRSGRIARLDALSAAYPLDAPILARARTLTPARLRALKSDLGIETVEDFASAVDSGAVVEIKGVGAKTAAVWERWVDDVLDRPTPSWVAVPLAGRLARHISRLQGTPVRAVRDVEPWTDLIRLSGGDLESWKESTALIRPDGRLHHGPEVIETAHEPEPELPIRTDLHVHSTWSPDGRQDLESIVRSAVDIGLSVVAVTDHGPDLHFGGMTLEALRERNRLINSRTDGVELLTGAELNIDTSGQVDFDADVLEELDVVVGGVHSAFDLDRPSQTARVVTAIRNPHLHVLAHPTGRRVGIRPGLELDMDEVFVAAAETRTALEINGHLDRLDLDVELARRALDAGCLLAANSDAHRPSDFDNLVTANLVARLAGASDEQLVTSWPLDRLGEWLRGG